MSRGAGPYLPTDSDAENQIAMHQEDATALWHTATGRVAVLDGGMRSPDTVAAVTVDVRNGLANPDQPFPTLKQV